MRQKSVHAESASERIVKNIRRATRKHYSAEEKIRIVLDGLRGESSIAELCRREGIAESLYYTWSKEFLEAGKRRLTGDTARAATNGEVKDICARSGLSASQQNGVLFDHFFGSYKQSLGHSDAQRLGGRDVNYKIELTWLLDRDVRRLRSAQYLVDKIGGTPKQLFSIWSIIDQSPSPDRVSERGHRWNPCRSRQLCNCNLIGIGQRIDANIEDITAALESLNGPAA
jgi:transposase